MTAHFQRLWAPAVGGGETCSLGLRASFTGASGGMCRSQGEKTAASELIHSSEAVGFISVIRKAGRTNDRGLRKAVSQQPSGGRDEGMRGWPRGPPWTRSEQG